MDCLFQLLTMMSWVPWQWNPMTGCTAISEGCKYCIAQGQRIKIDGEFWGQKNFKPTLHPKEFSTPVRELTPRSVLIAPRGDFFHEAFSFDVLHMLLDVLRLAPWHTYYFLTKRVERMYECLTSYGAWPLTNVNVGISAETQERLDQRLPILLAIPVHPTAHLYVSSEPLLGPMRFGTRITKLGAVIMGQERGNPNKRIVDPILLENVRNECLAAGIPCFHHGSNILEREQRPWNDLEMRGRQCTRRLRESQDGNRVLVQELKEIAEREGVSWHALTRRMGPEFFRDRCMILKGIMNPHSYQRARSFVDNYQAAIKGVHNATRKAR